jgi:hypothetical protein
MEQIVFNLAIMMSNAVIPIIHDNGDTTKFISDKI